MPRLPGLPTLPTFQERAGYRRRWLGPERSLECWQSWQCWQYWQCLKWMSVRPVWSTPAELGDHLQHQVVNQSVAREHASGARSEGLTRNRGDAPTGFLDNEAPGRHVPRLNLRLPIAIEPSRGDVTEVERRRPEPPHRLRFGDELPEQADELFGIPLDAVVKTRDEQRVDQRVRRRYPQRRPVQPGPLSALGGEQLTPGRVVHRPDHDLAVDLEGQR